MDISKKDISKTSTQLNITVSVDELKPFLEKAAKKMSLKNKIKGFRPGKADYNVIKQQFGEMSIYQEALNSVIDHTLIDALKKEDLDIAGQPKIDVNKMAPGNALEYTVTVDLMPKIELHQDWKDKVSVKLTKEDIKDDKVDETIDQLASQQSKQVLKEEAAKEGDKVVLDFELSFNKVVPDDGVAKDFEVTIGEKKMIPGFEQELIGLKANDEKTFKLKFPKEYYHKHFAGKEGEFKVKIKHVFNIEKPAKDDELAKSFNYKSFEELKKDVKSRLQQEKDMQLMQQAEVEMFDELIKNTKFGEIPETMIEEEKNRMINELKQNITQQGMKYEYYLEHMKKSEDDLKSEFSDDAKKRVQSGLIMRQMRQEEKINVSDEEVNAELEKAKQAFKDNPELLKQLDSPQYRMHILNNLVTQKVVKIMKDAIIKQ